MEITIIVAVAKNDAIGLDGRVPWHLSTDLKLFKQTTMGHHLIVGRRTWESIGRPLPGRQMVVITRNPDYALPEGVDVAHSLVEALVIARDRGETEAFVAGGAMIYALALPLATRMYYTEVLAEPEADTWFPDWDREEWQEPDCTAYPAGELDDHPFRWCVFQKKA